MIKDRLNTFLFSKLFISLIAITIVLALIFLGYSAKGNKTSTTENGIIKQIKIKNGVSIEFNAKPLDGPMIKAGEHAEIIFRINDAQTGEPVKGIYPAVWMDIAGESSLNKGSGSSCKDRVALYMQGLVGVRPLIDLNSYYVLVMNQNNSISVIDPIIGITGITKLYANIKLKAPGGEWAKSRDEKTMYVTMPSKSEVAIVDLITFTVKKNINAGLLPLRLKLQPDEKYLWIANDSNEKKTSGVTIIDVSTEKKVKFIETGLGHHELSFSHDSRYAYVSNRNSGTVTIIDIDTLKIIKTIKSIEQPIGLAYSEKSELLYITDGLKGEILVINGKTHKVDKKIKVKSGVSAIGISQDGRWAVATNTHEDVIYVIDVATNEIEHVIAVENRPYQVAFTRAFVYIRSLGSERVNLIELAHLGKKDTVPVASFAAGELAPGKVRDIGISQVIQEAPGEAAVLIVSPTDNTVYYYMEGMNAPMGNFRNYGNRPRAVQVADRTLREYEPGVYSAKVKIPASGKFDVAFIMESPSILHCFTLNSAVNEKLEKSNKPNVTFLKHKTNIKVNEEITLQVKIMNPVTKKPHAGLNDVKFIFYRAPSLDRKEVYAKEKGKGIYELTTRLKKTGVYYFYLSSVTAKTRINKSPFVSVIVK